MTAPLAYQNIVAFSRTPAGKRLLNFVRRAFMVAVFGYLAWQLTVIGWFEILKSLPTSPWFYLLFLVTYFSLPLTEMVLYRATWKTPMPGGIAAFIKKRVYNKDVFGYSGEIYLYLWARKVLPLKDRIVLGTIKDNTIVSSVSSIVFSVIVLGILFFSGQVAFMHTLTQHDVAYAVIGVILLGVLTAIGFRFRHSIFHVNGRMVATIFFVHLVRMFVIHIAMVGQWMAAVPGTPMQAWFTLLATQILISRLPFIPGRDLLFLGASVELAGVLSVSKAAIAGMMVVGSVLDRLSNFVLLGAVTLISRRRGQTAIEEPAEEEVLAMAALDTLDDADAVGRP